MSVPVLNAEGLPAGQADFTGRVAEQEIKPHLIHETVVAELAHRRAGTHATKTRSDVRGGGKKPWRQKGTGRARAGSIRSPLWRGGGVVFGPSPRSHGGKVNRKVRAQAFRSALRAHAERGSMAVMDPTGWDAPSTKRADAYLYQAPEGLAARPLLVVVDDPDGVEGLSFRNLHEVYVLAAGDLEVVDVMAGRSLLIERAVWERYVGGELEVSAVDVTAKALPERTPPPAPKPITRTKKEDDKPKRSRAKKADADAPAAEAEAPEAEVTEVAAAEVEAPEAAAPEAVAEEATAEAVIEEKPKRSRAKKAEPAAEEAPEADAEEKPKRSRAKKAEPAAEEAPEAEAEVEEKPKRTRAKKAEPAAEEATAEVEEKPKRTRKKAEPAEDGGE